MGCPNFTASVSSRLWETRASRKRGRTLPATLARLLMQATGPSQVSPQSAPSHFVGAPAPTAGAEAVVCFAGVAQLVEHLFCKQVVRGSSPRASSTGGRPLAAATSSESCPSGQREQAVNLPAYAYAGSNPALSTTQRGLQRLRAAGWGTNPAAGRSAPRVMSLAGVAQLVERQPSKLNVASSSLVSRSISFLRIEPK